MRNYIVPGVTVSLRGARTTGSLLVAAAVLTTASIYTFSGQQGSDGLEAHVRTEQVGDGITNGTVVQLDGVKVGKVASITSTEKGRQLVTLDLDRSQISGLNDDFELSYAPVNLFGVSAVVIKPTDGGPQLKDDATIDLTGANSSKVSDFTLGRLLETLTAESTTVLTPQLTDLLTTASSDLRRLAPFLESMMVLTRTAVDAQRYTPTSVIDHYSSFADGLGKYSSSTLTLMHSILNIEVFVHERDRFDATIAMFDRAFPAMGHDGDVTREYFGPYTDMYTPVMTALAATLPDPATSRAQLTDLLSRLDRAFADSPEGPVMNLDVVLRGVPGLAIPLRAQQALEAGGNR
ncbi:MlaD family protein [Nocardia vaccinii]|uniref:MlaD family protein n=1 Tax=Nocardia vaccinii TaxID=1822 RepID=UPI00082CCEA5|nr:MlaD family protein [Nocardia vaccinii]